MNGKITAQQGLIYLCACAIHHRKADDNVLAQLNLAAVYPLAKYHHLAALCFCPLEHHPELKGTEPYKSWENASYQTVMDNLTLSSQRKKLQDFCEKNEIACMPLKGAVIQKFYPHNTREMADNDIFYDAAKTQEIREFFEKDGFTVESFGKGRYDVYQKKQGVKFEMHRFLASAHNSPIWADYYTDIFKRLLPNKDRKYIKRFSDEDFYIYMILQAYKHYAEGKAGIRDLADGYIYRHAHPGLDMNYILDQLRILGIEDYERAAHGLAHSLFADPQERKQPVPILTSAQQEMFEFCLLSEQGSSVANPDPKRIKAMNRQRKDNSPLGRAASKGRQLFPGRDHMLIWCQAYAPWFAEHDRLLAAAPFYRLYKIGSRRVKRHLKGLKLLVMPQLSSKSH